MLRALAASLVVVLCSVGAHRAAGGDVAPWVFAVVLGSILPVARACAGRRMQTAQLLGLLLLGQLVVHLLAGDGGAHDASMVGAHVAATALSLVLVRRGEDVWWRVADALVAATSRCRGRLAPPTPPEDAGAIGVLWTPAVRRERAILRGRGPPVLV